MSTSFLEAAAQRAEEASSTALTTTAAAGSSDGKGPKFYVSGDSIYPLRPWQKRIIEDERTDHWTDEQLEEKARLVVAFTESNICEGEKISDPRAMFDRICDDAVAERSAMSPRRGPRKQGELKTSLYSKKPEIFEAIANGDEYNRRTRRAAQKVLKIKRKGGRQDEDDEPAEPSDVSALRHMLAMTTLEGEKKLFDQDKCPGFRAAKKLVSNYMGRLHCSQGGFLEKEEKERHKTHAGSKRWVGKALNLIHDEENTAEEQISTWELIAGASEVRTVRDPEDGYDMYYVAITEGRTVHVGKWTQPNREIHYSCWVVAYSHPSDFRDENVRHAHGRNDAMGVLYFNMCRVVQALCQCTALIERKLSHDLEALANGLQLMDNCRGTLKSAERNPSMYAVALEAMESLIKAQCRLALGLSRHARCDPPTHHTCCAPILTARPAHGS